MLLRIMLLSIPVLFLLALVVFVISRVLEWNKERKERQASEEENKWDIHRVLNIVKAVIAWTLMLLMMGCAALFYLSIAFM